MRKIKFTSWQDGEFYLGFLNDYPDYLTQAMSREELTDNLKSLLVDNGSAFSNMEQKMSTLISLAEAQPKLQELIDEVSISREPITITGKTHNAILISEEIWQGIQETIYLLSIPEVGESIKIGLLTPVSECSEELDW